jgi:hypothetical protein
MAPSWPAAMPAQTDGARLPAAMDGAFVETICTGGRTIRSSAPLMWHNGPGASSLSAREAGDTSSRLAAADRIPGSKIFVKITIAPNFDGPSSRI